MFEPTKVQKAALREFQKRGYTLKQIATFYDVTVEEVKKALKEIGHEQNNV